jgi:NTP pyrophosphatase (non-canonical NTP hydrolase)
MSDLANLQQKIVEFRDQRNWKQFHNPKDLAISLNLEAAEVLEHFQWKSAEEITKHLTDNRDEVAEELADVLYWVLLMAHDLDIDIVAASQQKMRKNDQKYPVHKAKDSHKKYTEL